ncbi:hypothetical protein AK812_SmicGene24918 [Symbiodinium microadriaticum]|uniref:Uncharacterized protein n=1 Tax=Symbiodinium microadriaticum TaxID=2951 RepID=A0A1Q9DDB0_SYMMI|nr:hypothetical protein AK812_SmicGene24918 [Symbiodinium microadriaticum]
MGSYWKTPSNVYGFLTVSGLENSTGSWRADRVKRPAGCRTNSSYQPPAADLPMYFDLIDGELRWIPPPPYSFPTMAAFEEQWSNKDLAHALCDTLVEKGQLKEKPAFVRLDREAKIADIFGSVGLDGAKMASFTNPGPLEVLVRKQTEGEDGMALR